MSDTIIVGMSGGVDSSVTAKILKDQGYNVECVFMKNWEGDPENCNAEEDYKDALSASGNKGVTRQYPFVPGIDAVGTVNESASNKFSEGDEVIVTGYDMGMNTPGGFGEYICVPESWVVNKPKNLSPLEVMSIGTAGLTAAASVLKITQSSSLD